MKSISQHIEKYDMGHYDSEELLQALVNDRHFDSIAEAAFFLEEEYGYSRFPAAEMISDFWLYEGRL